MTDSSPDSSQDALLRFDDAHLASAKRVVLFTVFLDILGFGIIIPQLAIYAAQYSATPEQIGLLASSYSAMQFLFAPFWGRMSDRIGRRPILVWSIFGTALGYILFAYAGALWMLFAARILDGITGANISTAQAYLSDVTAEKDRAKTFGIFGAIFGIGFAIGPLIGGFLANLPSPYGGNYGLGWFTAILSFINWALAFRLLPETLTPQMRAVNTARQNQQGGRFSLVNISGFKRAFAIPTLRRVLVTGFIGTLAFATLQGTYTTFILVKYARPDAQAKIKANPDAAVLDARRHMSQNEKIGTGANANHSEGAGMTDGLDNDDPFTAGLGGDFRFDRPNPPGLTWRRVEKVLVRYETTEMVKWIFTTIGILALIVQGGLIRPLKKHFSDVNLILFGTAMIALGLFLVPLASRFSGQFPSAALIAIGNGISAPILTALVSLLAPEAERGEVIGVFQSTQSFSRIIGPQIGGILFGAISPGAPYFVGAAIMMISFFVAMGLRGINFEPASASAKA